MMQMFGQHEAAWKCENIYTWIQTFICISGLGMLFSGPDLSRISEGPLVVSGVQHASSIELNEQGAEASAATSVTLVRTIPTFAVNMPFIFALVDDASYTPLFLGMVTNPNPGATAEQSDEPKTENETVPSNVRLTDTTLSDGPHENMLSYMLNMWRETVPQQFLGHQEMDQGN